MASTGVRYSSEVKEEALRLRTEKLLSLKDIASELGINKATASLWLRGHPLPKEELIKRMSTGLGGNKKKARAAESRLHKLVSDKDFSRLQKSKIAESAVLLRLSMFCMSAFCSPFDGDKADWLVETPSGEIYKIQVRWAKMHDVGLPTVSLRCANGAHGNRRFEEGEFDFIVGYDFYSDTAYVWSWNDVAHLKSAVTVSESTAEQWNKMLD